MSILVPRVPTLSQCFLCLETNPYCYRRDSIFDNCSSKIYDDKHKSLSNHFLKLVRRIYLAGRTVNIKKKTYLLLERQEVVGILQVCYTFLTTYPFRENAFLVLPRIALVGIK